jgi:hypothetical protein
MSAACDDYSRGCPTCGQPWARFVAFIGAPGYGHAGECDGCGARLWRSGGASWWRDVREMDGPPELSIEDVR